MLIPQCARLVGREPRYGMLHGGMLECGAHPVVSQQELDPVGGSVGGQIRVATPKDNDVSEDSPIIVKPEGGLPRVAIVECNLHHA